MQLGNLYFDAERYADAITWYEQALDARPERRRTCRTDLGVGYYYTNQPDRALAQFEHSLKIDPKHIKTLLNMGIVRAFGKQDLAGAAQGVAAGRAISRRTAPKARRRKKGARGHARARIRGGGARAGQLGA